MIASIQIFTYVQKVLLFLHQNMENLFAVVIPVIKNVRMGSQYAFGEKQITLTCNAHNISLQSENQVQQSLHGHKCSVVV